MYAIAATPFFAEPGFGPLHLEEDSVLFDFEQQAGLLPSDVSDGGDAYDHQPSPPTTFHHDDVEMVQVPDPELMMVKPEDITGQSLAVKMENDKNAALGDTHDLIREMEEFLGQYESESEAHEKEDAERKEISDLAEELLSLEQQHALMNIEAPLPPSTDEETRVAEEMLDMLLEEEDSGFFDASAVVQDSESNVIIVVEVPAPAAATKSLKRKKPGRKPERRTTRATRGVSDRKERKKLQNVEAARRYRDRKKREQTDVEEEESVLEAKNAALKERLLDIENEMKTMKRLMIELGMLKVVGGV